jgi:hypothetical protein
MGAVIARLTEPSTYAGLAGIAVAIGQGLPQYSTICHTIAIIAGAVAAGLPEGTKA